MDGRYRHYANGKPGLIESKEVPMDNFINSTCVCLDKFYVGKFHLNSAMSYSHHLPTEGWHTRRRLLYTESGTWTLDAWISDVWTLDSWTLDAWTLDVVKSANFRPGPFHGIREIGRISGKSQFPFFVDKTA